MNQTRNEQSIDSAGALGRVEKTVYAPSGVGMGNRRSRVFMIQAERRALWEQVQTTPRDLIEDVTFPGIGIRRVQVIFAPSFKPGFAWDVRVFGDAEWRLFRSRIVEVTEENFGEPARLVGYE